MFVDYIFARERTLPPIKPGNLYEYVVAADGVYVRAWRPGLTAMIRIGDAQPIRGLNMVSPYVLPDLRVPIRITVAMLSRAKQMGEREILFYLSGGCRTTNQPWSARIPRQIATATAVQAQEENSGADTVIELHSHNHMGAFFSFTDDNDEQTGFRIFAVIGKLDCRPEILVRVGIYGHFAYIPANTIFELPAGMHDRFADMEELDGTQI